MKNIRFLNPYTFLSAGWLITLIAYEVHWSTIYPVLSTSLLFFLIIFMICLGLFGFFLVPFFGTILKSSRKEKLPYANKLINFLLIFIIIGTIADGIYSKGFPILGQVIYNSFGIPVLHPITVIFSIFLSIYSIQLFCSYTYKRKKSLLTLFLSFLPSLIAFSRGILILSLITVSTIYLYNKFERIGLKTFILAFLVLILGAFAFGVAGNYRFNNQMGLETTDPLDSSLIYQLGSASSKVPTSSVVAPLFWPYVYLTSPTANLESAVNSNVSLDDGNNSLGKFVVTQLTPDVVSTKVYPEYKKQVQDNGYSNRISAGLTVSTAFYDSFVQLGWVGIFFMAIVFLIFPVVYLYIIYRIQPGFVIISMSILDCLYLLALFDNPWPFSGLSVQLLLILFAAFLFRNSKKINNE